MNTVIIRNPRFCTKMDILAPRYHDKKDGKDRDWVALLACYKVNMAGPLILVEFTKYPHLKGLRYCISKEEAMRHEIGSNGAIDCYLIPMADFSTWETMAEARDKALGAFNF